jgi:hypothetical protein
MPDTEMKTIDKTVWSAAIAVVILAVITAAGLEAKRRAERAALAAARAKAEPWRELSGWEGTRLATTSGIPEPVANAFADDPPAPEIRKATFESFLKPSTPYPCVGWNLGFEKVTPNANGWEVTVKSSTRLKSLGGGVPFCQGSTTEIWQVSRGGSANFLRSSAASVGLFFVD